MVTLQEAWNKYERRLKNLLQASEHTIKNYKSTIRKLAEFLGGWDVDVEIIDTTTVEDFLIAEGEKGASLTTLKRHYYALKSFLSYAGVQVDWKSIRLPTTPRKLDYKILPEDEIKRIIELAFRLNKTKYALMLWIGYEAGLRVSELCRLKVNDIDFDRCMALIRPSKREEPTEIPLSQELCAELRNYVETEGLSANDYLFKTKFGKPWRPDVFLKQVFRPIAEMAGYPDLRYHDFARHSRATNLLRRGVDIYTVNRIMRHKLLQTTLTYLHFVGEELRRRLEQVGKEESH